MKKTYLRVFGFVFCLLMGLGLMNISEAVSQEFPTRPVKLIVPYSPGGVADLTWRAMAEPMSKVLGQPIVIENKPGGGATLGYTAVMKSNPDGYTVGHCALGSFINNYLTYDVAYHPINSYTFLGGVARYAESIVVKSDAPWKTWDEFVDYIMKHPNEVRVGFSGPRSSNTIAAKWIAKKLGLKWREVTFHGDAEGITALLGGHVEAFPGAGPQNMLVKDGRARMLLALTVDPIPGFENVPTFKQKFGEDTMNASGLMGPAGIPKLVLDKWEKAVQEGTKDPKFIQTMEKMNMTPLGRSSKEFTQDVKTALKSFQDFLQDLDLLKKK